MKSAEVAFWVTALVSQALALLLTILTIGSGIPGIVLLVVLVLLSYRATYLAGKRGIKIRISKED